MMKRFAAILLSFVLLIGLASCSGEAKSADLTAVMDDMKAVLENTEMMDITAENLMPQYGIDSAACRLY